MMEIVFDEYFEQETEIEFDGETFIGRGQITIYRQPETESENG